MAGRRSIDDIRNIVAPIASRYGVDRVYLFGSYARNQASARSDIDLRIDADAITDLLELGGLYSDLEEALGQPIDLLTTDSLEKRFLDRIEKEEILIYGQ